MSFKTAGIAATALAAILALTSGARAAEMKVGGAMTGGFVHQEAHPLDAPDHIVLSAIAKGTHKSPGSPLDGADFQISETLTLDKGNGPQNGEITFVNDKGSITNEIHGTAKTVMVGGQPRTTLSGTYKMVAGTGMFAGGNGHGTYNVAMTSPKDFAGDYKGVLTIPKMQAAR